MKHYCPEHGLELNVAWEKNRYVVIVAGEYPLTLGEDFDEKTGERLYCTVGHCPVKGRTLFGLFASDESHYHKLIPYPEERSEAERMSAKRPKETGITS